MLLPLLLLLLLLSCCRCQQSFSFHAARPCMTFNELAMLGTHLGDTKLAASTY
jgi:hypothetical protein